MAALAVLRLLAQEATKFSTGVNVVNVYATVRNRQWQIVRNLTKDDFILDEHEVGRRVSRTSPKRAICR